MTEPTVKQEKYDPVSVPASLVIHFSLLGLTYVLALDGAGELVTWRFLVIGVLLAALVFAVRAEGLRRDRRWPDEKR